MLPKHSKHYVVPTAERLNKSTEVVEDVVSFFYSTVRKTLVAMAFPVIQVDGLGSFRVKPKKLASLNAKYTKHLEGTTLETFNQVAIRKEIENKLAKVERLQEIVKEERQRKKEFFKAKNDGFKENTKE